MPVLIEPGKPVTIVLHFRSPHMVAYRLRSRWPGGAWEVFALGTERDAGLPHGLDRLTGGSRIGYRFLYTGHAETPFRVTIEVRQDDRTCPGGRVEIESRGTGAGGEQGEIDLLDAAAREAS